VAARSQMLTKLKNTIAYVKHLIGRKYSDPVVQHELPLIPCAVVKLDGDQIGLKVCSKLCNEWA
jgi:molecular chaperone DnaK (HSP70)